MKLRRLLLNLLCVGSLLIQTSAFAWSPQSLLPHKAATEQAQGMPCHGDQTPDRQQDATHDCCCHDQCSCEDFCAGTSVSLPSQPAGPPHLIGAHFMTAMAQPAPLTTRSHPRFRPPISHPS